MVRISHYEFGSYIIDGKRYERDIKIIDGRITSWHNHHLALDDVEDAVKSHPEIIIIGTGMHGVLEVTDEIRDYIESRGIELVIVKTKEACSEFNSLTLHGKKVAAILHGTC